jgi:hypothetical protein
MGCMACLYFFGSATSVCRYDYGNSELNFAISWLRGLAKIVKSQVLRRYQMRIKGLRSRAAPRNLARSFSQRTPICSDRVSTLSDSNLQTTRPAERFIPSLQSDWWRLACRADARAPASGVPLPPIESYPRPNQIASNARTHSKTQVRITGVVDYPRRGSGRMSPDGFVQNHSDFLTDTR